MRVILFSLLLLVGYLTAARYAFLYLQSPASAQTLEEEENLFLLLAETNEFPQRAQGWLAESIRSDSPPGNDRGGGGVPRNVVIAGVKQYAAKVD